MSRAGTIDGPQFARDRGTISGALDIAALARLAASGCEAAALRYRVSGSVNARGRGCLVVEASGAAQLTCQRCLGALELPIGLAVELELAESEQEIGAADDDVDRVLATKAMDVVALVEDEVLLALPMAPRHERCGQNAARGGGERTGPFAALAALRRGGDDGRWPATRLTRRSR
jgi:uncharacterized protein